VRIKEPPNDRSPSLAFSALILANGVLPAQGTAADYARSEGLRRKVENTVLGAPQNATCIATTTSFWYRKSEDQIQPKHETLLYNKPGDVVDIEQPVLFDITAKRQTIPTSTPLAGSGTASLAGMVPPSPPWLAGEGDAVRRGPRQIDARSAAPSTLSEPQSGSAENS
jgi:hypothetical protein